MYQQTIPLHLNIAAHSPGELPENLWLAEATHAREILEDEWPTAVSDLPEGHPLDLHVRRTTVDGGWSAYGHLHAAAVHLECASGYLDVLAAAEELSSCQQAVAAIRELFPESKPEDNRIPVTFWMCGDGRAVPRERRLESPSWADVRANYAAGTAAQLTSLMALRRPGSGGRLLLWHGLPGTGKTWALRALAYEWREWCELHYISDPEVFLGHEPRYMLDVALNVDDDDDGEEADGEHAEGKWRLIVLEDAGEMLSLDAKERVGQALSRLLNVTDGLLGQGSRILVLITTNEELGTLHPAVQRPGRCAAVVTFDALDRERAVQWLAARGSDVRPGGARTLAELYGLLEGVSRPPAERRQVGFAVPSATR